MVIGVVNLSAIAKRQSSSSCSWGKAVGEVFTWHQEQIRSSDGGGEADD
jgi:hypothetical protein